MSLKKFLKKNDFFMTFYKGMYGNEVPDTVKKDYGSQG